MAVSPGVIVLMGLAVACVVVLATPIWAGWLNRWWDYLDERFNQPRDRR